MNRYQQAQINQVLYRLRPQNKTGMDTHVKVERDEAFITRIEKAVTEKMIDEVLKSPVALKRLSGPIERK